MLMTLSIILALVVLWAWLGAVHWFARAMVFVLLAVLSSGVVAVCDAYPNRGFFIPVAIGLSWLIASAPTYRARHQARNESLEMALR